MKSDILFIPKKKTVIQKFSWSQTISWGESQTTRQNLQEEQKKWSVVDPGSDSEDIVVPVETDGILGVRVM